MPRKQRVPPTNTTQVAIGVDGGAGGRHGAVSLACAKRNHVGRSLYRFVSVRFLLRNVVSVDNYRFLTCSSLAALRLGLGFVVSLQGLGAADQPAMGLLPAKGGRGAVSGLQYTRSSVE